MKPLRVVLIGVGIVLVLLLGMIALGFHSGVQTWAARRALAAEPDLTGEIGRVDVGLRQVRAEGVTLRRPGMTLTLPTLEADLSVFGLLRDRLEIHRLVAKGWTLELTGAAPDTDTAPAASPSRPPGEAGLLRLPFAALAQQPPDSAAPPGVPASDLWSALRLPVDLSLDGLDLEGDVIVTAAPDSAALRSHVVIQGGGLAAGREGTFRIHADTRQEDAAAAVNRVTLESEAAVGMRTPRTFDRIRLASVLDAHGPRLPEGARLQVDAVAGTDDEGTAYTLDLRTPEKSLLQLEAMPVSPGSSHLQGDWRLAMSDADLAPFALGQALPGFVATGGGRLDVLPDRQEVGGRIQLEAQGLERIRPELEAVGSLMTMTEFEARRAGENVRVTRLRIRVGGEQPVADIAALQGLEVDLAQGELRVPDPDEDLLRIELLGLPLDWARSFVAPYTVSGGPAQGIWIAAAREGGLVLRSAAPLRAGRVTVADGQGEVLVQEIDLAASLSGEFMPSGWQGRVDGHVQSGTNRLLGFDARAGQAAAAGAPLVVTSRFTADLGRWMEQPLARDHQMFRSGGATGYFIVALSDGMELAAELELGNLVTVTGEAVPRLALKVRADQAADGRIEAHVPLRVTHDGRASDVTLDVQARPDDARWQVDAVAAGQHVFVQDLQLLALPLAGEPEADREPDDQDEAPVWSDWEGKLSLSFGTVVYAEGLTASDVKGEVRFGAGEIQFSDLRAALDTGGTVGFSGALRFDAAAAAPYALQGEVAATGLEVGRLMRAVSPDAQPPVEGTFNLTSTLNGRAVDLAGLGAALAAEAKLTSRGGVLRALSVDVSRYLQAGSALGNVAGLIGSLTGDSRTQRYAERVKAATELAQELGNLAFDQLNIDVVRRPGDALIIRDLNLISPTIRLLGSGSIGDQPGQSLWREPLQLRLQLAAREGMAARLRTLNLLRQQPDALGYLPMIEDFQLQGSLDNITTQQLGSLLGRALSGL